MAKHDRANGVSKIMKWLTFLRAFTVIALVVSGLVDLSASGFFSTPLEQISVSAAAGVLGAYALKFAHLA